MPAVTVVGSYNQDLFMSTERLPAPGETRLGKLSYAHGGKGFNQALACQRLGAHTLLLAAVGDDGAGKGVRHYARSQNLDCRWRQSVQPTGVAVIVRDDRGQNQIVVAAGANLTLTAQDVATVQTEIAASRVVLSQLECPPAAVAEAFRIGRQAGATTILNPAPAPESVDKMLLALTDVLTPNETEFAELVRGAGLELPARWPGGDDQATHEACRRLCDATVVVTLGQRGGFFSQPGGRYGRYSTPAVQVVDSTGAGDAFNGALAAGLAHGWPLDTALSRAAAAAAVSVTRPGAAPSMPDRDEAGWPAD